MSQKMRKTYLVSSKSNMHVMMWGGGQLLYLLYPCFSISGGFDKKPTIQIQGEFIVTQMSK